MENISNLNEDENVIEFKNVKFAYPGADVNAVNGVNLSVRRGEFLSVIGSNGSGKSTLARLANGLLEADGGTITVFGMNVGEGKNATEIRKRVGIVFQNPDNQTVASIVEDDIAFGPENIGVEREEIGRRIEWALKAVGMEEYRKSTPSRLSGGQKQRIAIAGVLAIKPEVIILDESTAMLDPKGRREVIDVIKKLNEEEGMTVVLITHFMEEALLADRTIVMNRGEIVMTGTPEEIFENGESLEIFNLCRPRISKVSDILNSAGMDLKSTLDIGELGREIAEKLKLKKFENEYKRTKSESGAHDWDIDISHLTYTYSKKSPFASRALKDVNLHIDEGEFFGIIGHTGSGKSTLIQHLNALLRLPQAEKHYKKPKSKHGEILPPEPKLTIGKFDLSDRKTDFKALRADVGMVFQYPEYQLFAESVFDDVAFGLKNFKKELSSEDIEKAVRESIEEVGLDYAEVKDKSPFDLSGGQKRRVAIAGVIVTKPHILVLDEPAAGLDPAGKRDIMELLHKLHKEWCKTVIIVSHDMDEVAENCTRAAVISGGEAVLCAPPEELFEKEEELYSLGLGVPFATKLRGVLKENGIDIDGECTPEAYARRIADLYSGGENA